MCTPYKDENDTRIAVVAAAFDDKELFEEWKKERERRIRHNEMVRKMQRGNSNITRFAADAIIFIVAHAVIFYAIYLIYRYVLV